MASTKSRKAKKKVKVAAAALPHITAMVSHHGSLFVAKSDGSLWERHTVPATDTEPESLIWDQVPTK